MSAFRGTWKASGASTASASAAAFGSDRHEPSTVSSATASKGRAAVMVLTPQSRLPSTPTCYRSSRPRVFRRGWSTEPPTMRAVWRRPTARERPGAGRSRAWRRRWRRPRDWWGTGSRPQRRGPRVWHAPASSRWAAGQAPGRARLACQLPP